MLETLPKPVVAAVHGHCYTGALEVALAADFILAADDAKFGDTHAKWSLTPVWGMSQRLPRRVGAATAKRMMFTADTILADEALRIGLAEFVVPAADFDAEIEALARRLLAGSTFTQAAAKRLLDATDGMGLDPDLSPHLLAPPSSSPSSTRSFFPSGGAQAAAQCAAMHLTLEALLSARLPATVACLVQDHFTAGTTSPPAPPGAGAAAATALSATPSRGGGPASLPARPPAGASVSASSSPSPPAPEGPAVSSFSLARLSNAVFPGMLAPILLPAGRRDLLMGCVVTGFLKGGWRSLLQHATALLQLLKQDVKTGGRRGDGGRGLERDDAVATGAAEGSPGAWAGADPVVEQMRRLVQRRRVRLHLLRGELSPHRRVERLLGGSKSVAQGRHQCRCHRRGWPDCAPPCSFLLCRMSSLPHARRSA